jgi:hypothetical protein
VGVKEARWDKGDPVREVIFFYGKLNENHQLGNRIYLFTTEQYQQLRE